MNKFNKSNQYNSGFSLVEVIVTIAITAIVCLGISTFYTFYRERQIQAARTQNISSTMDLLRNTLISDYKFHRGDNPPLIDPAGSVIGSNFRPNRNRVRIYETTLWKSTVNGINFGLYGLSFVLPMTQKEMEANSTGKKVEYSNTKFLIIEQLVKQNDGSTKIKRIEYRMRCQALPTSIKDRLSQYKNAAKTKLRLIDLLNEVKFFESTKCMKYAKGNSASETEYARWYGSDDKTPTYYVTPCLNPHHWSAKPQTVVIQRDVWEDWKEKWDWATSWDIHHAINNTTYYPNDIKTNENPPILGVAFCSWVPTEEDIMTANNTEIELYYFMLDQNSYMNPNVRPKIEVKTERLSLKRDSSITTKISPIK